MDLGGLDLERWLVALFLGAARTVPIVFLVPAFGGPSLPTTVRMGLGFALSALCLPYTVSLAPVAAGPILWIALLAREIAVGAVVGFVVACFFKAAEAAGRLTDILRGANMAEVLAPMSEGRSSPLGEIYLLLAVVIFVAAGGLGHVAIALARSYEAVPLRALETTVTLGAVAKLVIWSSGKLVASAVALAAPAVVAFLLADVVLAGVARMAPQIPIFFVGMPLKALAGVGVVLVSLGGLTTVLESRQGELLSAMARAFALWK